MAVAMVAPAKTYVWCKTNYKTFNLNNIITNAMKECACVRELMRFREMRIDSNICQNSIWLHLNHIISSAWVNHAPMLRHTHTCTQNTDTATRKTFDNMVLLKTFQFVPERKMRSDGMRAWALVVAVCVAHIGFELRWLHRNNQIYTSESFR